MAMIDEIMEQTVKMKEMTNKQRAEYIWHYYKWYIIGTIIGIACLVSIVSEIVKNTRPVYLFAEFVNSNMAFDTTGSTIEEDFIKEYNINTNKTPLAFDFNTVLQDSALDNTTNYANQMRVMAEYTAKQLDIVCGPESIVAGDIDAGAYANFEEVLPEDLLAEIKSKGYDLWTYTEAADPDFNTPEKTYIAGFYIDTCPYLNNQGLAGLYTVNDGDRPIITIAVNTQHLDHAIEFIRMIIKQ